MVLNIQTKLLVLMAGLTAAVLFETELGGEAVYTFVSPLGRGERVYYVASVPKAEELKIIDELQKSILLTAVISILRAMDLNQEILDQLKAAVRQSVVEDNKGPGRAPPALNAEPGSTHALLRRCHQPLRAGGPAQR